MYKNMCFELASLLYKTNVNVDSFNLLELCLLSYVELPNSNNKNISREIFEDNNSSENQSDSIATIEEKIQDKQSESKVSDLVKVRINNCFVSANKKLLQTNKGLWTEFVNSLENKKIKGMLLDTEIVLASDSILVIKTDFPGKADNINNNLSLIEEEFNKNTNMMYNLIAISNSNWQKEMEKYKENLKNNIAYKMLKEPSLDNDSTLDDIFSKQKIEIK